MDVQRLIRLNAELGKADEIAKLPARTVAAVLAHPDDALLWSTDRPLVELLECDELEGYTVFGPKYELRYNVPVASEPTFGLDISDIALFGTLSFGDYFFLSFVTTAGVERVALVVRGR